MERTPIAVLGASGYSGIEATRILAQHPKAELRVVASDRWQGETVEKRAGVRGPAGRLRYAPQERAAELARECAAALLCTPVDASLQLAPALLAAGVKVVDLSGAFRLADPAAFRAAYGLDHPRPDLLRESVYGLPELGEREAIGRARLVANPGCYPTAAALALVPLLRAGVLAPGEAIVDAASGTTGAGRKATEEMSFTEVMDDFRAYRVLRHQHTPEIAQALSRAAGRDVPLTFTAHLLPLRRGILATCYARLAEGRTGRDAAGALSHIYATEPFLDLAAGPDEVSLKAVVGTNRCQIGLAADAGRIVVISAIDNLVKGAAGQAVQNLNLALGWPETSGLDTLRGFNP
ncbi:MAG TPA: N-acetyl-gamma-glutamyl-phosphate reductase [Myxococcales bacterium]|nr:N-acetyl-gamma-glutamyl-phosphate reductase [Myxococcales bacterium]